MEFLAPSPIRWHALQTKKTFSPAAASAACTGAPKPNASVSASRKTTALVRIIVDTFHRALSHVGGAGWGQNRNYSTHSEAIMTLQSPQSTLSRRALSK